VRHLPEIVGKAGTSLVPATGAGRLCDRDVRRSLVAIADKRPTHLAKFGRPAGSFDANPSGVRGCLEKRGACRGLPDSDVQ